MAAKKDYVVTETVYGLGKDPEDPVRPGEPFKADPQTVQPLIDKGICKEHKPDAPQKKTGGSPAKGGKPSGGSSDGDLIDRIVLVVAELDPEDKDAWTVDGVPRVDALEDVLGEDITEEQRDAAWEKAKQAS